MTTLSCQSQDDWIDLLPPYTMIPETMFSSRYGIEHAPKRLQLRKINTSHDAHRHDRERNTSGAFITRPPRYLVELGLGRLNGANVGDRRLARAAFPS